MIRLATSLALAAAALIPAVALAQDASYYTATPVTPIAAPRLVIGSGIWQQAPGGTLFAARAPQRAAVLCRMVAHQVGPLASFTAGGEAFGAEALTACNVRAKGAAAPGR